MHRALLLIAALVAIAAPAGAQSFPIPPAQLAPAVVVFPGSASQVLAVDGTAAAPSISFASQPGLGMYRKAGDQLGFVVPAYSTTAAIFGLTSSVNIGSAAAFGWSSAADAFSGLDTSFTRSAAGTVALTGTTPMIQLGGTTSSFPALKRNGANIQALLADSSAYAFFQAHSYFIGGTLLLSGNAPTISSGFGTSPSIVNSNGPGAFTVNVGTGGVATSGVIGLSTATTGWNCFVIDRTNNTVTRETATTTTSVTLTAAAAWAASDILQVSCFAY
jgi:hypothetical protein